MPLQIVGLGGEEKKIVVLNAPLEPSGHSIIQKKFAHPVQTAPPLKESEAKDVVCTRQYLTNTHSGFSYSNWVWFARLDELDMHNLVDYAWIGEMFISIIHITR